MAAHDTSSASMNFKENIQSGSSRVDNPDGSRAAERGRGRGGYQSAGGRRGGFSNHRPYGKNFRGGDGEFRSGSNADGIKSEQELGVLAQKLVKFDCTPDAFVLLSNQLDARNDRFERCVRTSRDITIESKRIIYQLQRLAGQNDLHSRAAVLTSVHDRLRALVDEKFKQLHAELLAGTVGSSTTKAPVSARSEFVMTDSNAGYGENDAGVSVDGTIPAVVGISDPLDHHYFARAFSPGMQEFIESLTLYYFLKTSRLMDLSEVRDFLDCRFETAFDETGVDAARGRHLIDMVSAGDYLLGILDLPGELNRIAVVEAGSTGDCSRIQPICQLLQRLYSVTKTMKVPRDISRTFQFKIKVLKTSLVKVEKIIYELEWRKYDGLPLLGCGDVLMVEEQSTQQAVGVDANDAVTTFSEMG